MTGSSPDIERALGATTSTVYSRVLLAAVSLSGNATAGEEIAYLDPNPYLGSVAAAGISATVLPVDRLSIVASYYRELFSRSRSLDPR